MWFLDLFDVKVVYSAKNVGSHLFHLDLQLLNPADHQISIDDAIVEGQTPYPIE
jgi:hypothetical protein